MGYGQFIEERIFKPLRMTHSYYERVQKLLPGRVSGYVKKDDEFLNAAYLSMTQLYAAGGLDSSVDDLALWDAAISAGKLLKPGSWERIFTPYKFAGGEVSPYAYGWAIDELQGRRATGHAGGIPGFRTYVLRLPEDHVYVALLSNDETAETQPEVVARRIAAIAIGKPITESKIIQLDAKTLETLAGEYRGAAADDTLTVRREGSRLFAQGPEDPAVELFPVSQSRFIIKAFDARITFVRDAKGNVIGLIESFGGRDTNLKKIK